VDSWRGALTLGGNDRNETVAKPPQRRFRRRASPAKPGIRQSAGPRRWVGPRGGCALRGVRTGVNCLRHPARGGVGMTASICARAHATVRWYRLTGVRLVRHTSVDHRGLLLSRVSRGNMGASSQFKGGGQNKFD